MPQVGTPGRNRPAGHQPADDGREPDFIAIGHRMFHRLRDDHLMWQRVRMMRACGSRGSTCSASPS